MNDAKLLSMHMIPNLHKLSLTSITPSTSTLHTISITPLSVRTNATTYYDHSTSLVNALCPQIDIFDNNQLAFYHDTSNKDNDDITYKDYYSHEEEYK